MHRFCPRHIPIPAGTQQRSGVRCAATAAKLTGCYPCCLDVLDDPSAWRSAGFTVSAAGLIDLGEMAIRLLGRSKGSPQAGGIDGWSFVGGGAAGVLEVDGIPVRPAPAPSSQVGSGAAEATERHPNGAVSVDHIVLRSPDVDRSIAALGKLGITPIRETSTVRRGVRQVIFRPSATIIELVGSKNTAGSPPHLWGLTLVTHDVDATHAQLPTSTKEPWPAVQPGRRMTVLRHQEHSISVAIAFMTPHISGLEGNGEARERLFEARARAQEDLLRSRSREETGRSSGASAGSGAAKL